jgi:hypothetical protein
VIPQLLPALAGLFHPVHGAGGAGTGRRYGAQFTLRLPTGGLADAVAVDEPAMRLAGSFAPITYDALTAAAPLAATLEATGDGAVIVQLDGPRRLSSVRLQPSTPATTAVLVHRVDGRVATDAPTLVVGGAASATGQLHTVRETFLADRFALRRRTTAGDLPLTQAQLKALVVTGDPDNPTLGLRHAGSDTAPTPLFTGAVAGGVDFDVRTVANELSRLLAELPRPLPDPVDLELVAGADGPSQVHFDIVALPYRLSASGFADLPLRISDVADPDGLLRRLRGPPDPVSAHLRAALSARTRSAVDARTGAALGLAVVDLGAALSAGPLWEPQRFLGIGLPADAAALVAESPTGARRDRLNRLLLEAAWPGVLVPRVEQRRLAVTANAPGPEVAVAVSPGVRAPSGVLAVRPLVEGARPETGDGAPPAATAGIAVDGPVAVAAALDLAAAARTEGVEVALFVRDVEGAFSAELRADHLGAPDGTVIRSGPIAVAARGAAAWARLRFDDPLTLQPGRSWVVVRADAGRAVWLTTNDASAAPASVRLASPGSGWEPMDADGSAPLIQLLTHADELAPPPLAAWAGDTAIHGTPLDNGALVFVLDPLLAAGGILALRLRSLASGHLVIDPPTVTYDL